MRTAPERIRCTLLNGSAWSTEKKYMRRYKGAFDIFFWIEHRMREEKMEEHVNKKAKQGKRFAARITDVSASSKYWEGTIGGVFCGN